MAKAFYEYADDNGAIHSFLQDTAVAAALGNTPAAANTPRLPDKLKPRRVSIVLAPGKYTRPVVSLPATYQGLVPGAALLGGVICGKDGEVNNGFSR